MKISATGNYNSLFYLAAFFTFVIFIGLSLGGQSGLIQLWHLKKQNSSKRKSFFKDRTKKFG